MPGATVIGGRVSDIASLWPLALVVLVLVLVAVFYKEFRIRLVKGGLRLRSGNRELVLDATTVDSTRVSDTVDVEEMASPREAIADSREKSGGDDPPPDHPHIDEPGDESEVTWATVMF